jgi:hypothetical protein
MLLLWQIVFLEVINFLLILQRVLILGIISRAIVVASIPKTSEPYTLTKINCN